MKKLVMALVFVLVLSATAFADFIWDPMSLGYTNLSLKGNMTMGSKILGKAPTTLFTDKGSLSMNNFAFMPLVAGFGYLPKDKGFYFMWENIVGLGACKIKSQKTDELVEKLKIPNKAESSLSVDYATSFIFGYAFSPINDLYVSFGSGISIGVFAGEQSYKYSDISIKQVRNTFGFFVGLPLDVTARYFFTKHVGLLFGIQDTIMVLPSGLHRTGIDINGDDDSRLYADIDTMVANKFTLKFGLSTRW